MAMGHNQWYEFGVGAPPNLGCSLGVQGFDPWPSQEKGPPPILFVETTRSASEAVPFVLSSPGIAGPSGL